MSQGTCCNIPHMATFFFQFEKKKAFSSNWLIIIIDYLKNKECRIEKKFIKKTVVKYKNYVIETGNVSQCCSFSHIRSVLFGLLRQWSAWSLKQGICCKNDGMSIWSCFDTMEYLSVFTFDTLALDLSLHTTHGYSSGYLFSAAVIPKASRYSNRMKVFQKQCASFLNPLPDRIIQKYSWNQSRTFS